MNNFDLKKYLAEGKLNEEPNHPSDVFTDEQLDYITDTLRDMYETLGLADEEDPSSTDVTKSDALFAAIEGFFETLD